jgi:hypothetical protein
MRSVYAQNQILNYCEINSLQGIIEYFCLNKILYKMKNIFLITLLCFSFSFGAMAQKYRLFPEMEIKSLASNQGELTLKTGEVISGQLSLATITTSAGLQRIASVRIQNEDGKQKFKPKAIQELKVKAEKSDVSANSAGLKKAIQLFTESNAEYYIFKSVNDNKGKPRLMQLLNPGFDSKLQIYADAKSKQSAFAGFSNNNGVKTYFFTKKDGQKKATYLKKRKYKKMFSKMYTDCSAMNDMFGEKIKWGDFAHHVFYYDQDCE